MEKKWLGKTAIYAMTYMGIAMLMQIVVTWTMYFFAPPADIRQAYLSVTSIGFILALGRVVDAVTDPLIGIWSDNTRTRMGKRLPFIVAGGLPLALSFILLWHPPTTHPSPQNFIYTMLIISAFFFFYTMVTCPFLALIPEVAEKKEKRPLVSSFLAFFYLMGLAIAMIGSAIMIEKFGFQGMGWVIGLLALFCFYMPLLMVKEKNIARQKKKISFHEAFKLSLKNRSFTTYIICQPFFWFGLQLTLMGLPYIMVTMIGIEDYNTGWSLAIALGVALLSFPLILFLSKKLGKKRLFINIMVFACFILCLLPFVGLGYLPISLSIPMQTYVLIGLAGIPLAGLFILPNVMMADIIDEDEKIAGHRREAFYYGAQGFMVKLAVGLSALGLALLMHFLGYSGDDPLGPILIGPLAALFILIGVVLFKKYPIDE